LQKGYLKDGWGTILSQQIKRNGDETGRCWQLMALQKKTEKSKVRGQDGKGEIASVTNMRKNWRGSLSQALEKERK